MKQAVVHGQHEMGSGLLDRAASAMPPHHCGGKRAPLDVEHRAAGQAAEIKRSVCTYWVVKRVVAGKG